MEIAIISKNKRGKKMKKKIGMLLLCVVFMLTGCGMFDPNVDYDNDEKIASQANTYSKVNYRASEIDNTYELTCEVFEGMDTIWTYKASEDMERNVLITFRVESGKAKLVLISPDDTVKTIVEATEESGAVEEVEVTLSLEEGSNRIKLVGIEDTSVELEMTFEE